jgi:hypothetical protein
MQTVLICPGERPGVGFLAQGVPLVLVPMLGENLIHYWLESLASAGRKEIVILATDRPEMVRRAVGTGARWGVRAEVRTELRELTPADVLAKMQFPGGDSGAVERIIMLDHFPEGQEGSLFRTYRDWFATVLEWMKRAANPNRVGLEEIQPGVWSGRRTRVASSATLVAPCWLGDQVRVGPDAVIGPNSILESRVVVDSAAEVRSSFVGPETFIGALTKIQDSIAWGSTLIDWPSGSCTQVPDPFLLCALGRHGSGNSAVEDGESFWTALAHPWDMVKQLKLRSR